MIKLALRLAVIGFALASTHQAFAAGYEKSIMWGGRSAGLAGIATPWIKGSQALYFNPAGLVQDQAGQQDVSLALSPTWDQFSGPINNNNDTATSERSLSMPFGLMYGKTQNEQWGWGVGYFVSGGSKASYENVDMGTFGNEADVETNLAITELSAGVGYKVNDKLRVGAALRMAMAQADFAFVQRIPGPALVNAKFNGLKDSDAMGFRLGAQYKLDDSTNLGLNYRSQINLEANGTVSGQVYSAAPTSQIPEASATATTVFPQQLSLGGDHVFTELWRGMAEYSWTQYSKVDQVSIHTESGLIGDTALVQNWHDQHNIRLATEYTGCHHPIRFGYGWTSRVTDPDFARASFTPPGMAHTFTLGSGYSFDVSGKPMTLDWAYEYTRATGSGNGATAGSAAGDIRAGEFKAEVHAIHLAAAYLF